jgi:protein-S-isoprenylcysteine O-methyltransferase Ste14
MATDAVVGLTPRAGANRRTWSDWAGSIFFLALGVFLIARMPRGAWMVLPSILYDVVVSMTFLIRRPALRTDSSWLAHAAAYLSTFLVPAYLQFAFAVTPDTVLPTSVVLANIAIIVWAIGLGFVILTIWRLRFAFSIVPQARVLQTTGPYRLVRHPIYLGYTIIYLAYWMAHMHLALGAIMLIWLGATLLRIRYEESVLLAAFPEYSAYQAKVGRLWPVPR